MTETPRDEDDAWFETFYRETPDSILDVWGGKDAIDDARQRGKEACTRLRVLLQQIAAGGVPEATMEMLCPPEYYGNRQEYHADGSGVMHNTELWTVYGSLHTSEASYQVTITGPWSPLPVPTATEEVTDARS